MTPPGLDRPAASKWWFRGLFLHINMAPSDPMQLDLDEIFASLFNAIKERVMLVKVMPLVSKRCHKSWHTITSQQTDTLTCLLYGCRWSELTSDERLWSLVCREDFEMTEK